MLSLIIGCSFLFKPLAAPAAAPTRSARAELFNVDIWRRRKYVIWALAIPTALFGYFVPYVHMVSIAVSRSGGAHDAAASEATFVPVAFAHTPLPPAGHPSPSYPALLSYCYFETSR